MKGGRGHVNKKKARLRYIHHHPPQKNKFAYELKDWWAQGGIDFLVVKPRAPSLTFEPDDLTWGGGLNPTEPCVDDAVHFVVVALVMMPWAILLAAGVIMVVSSYSVALTALPRKANTRGSLEITNAGRRCRAGYR